MSEYRIRYRRFTRLTFFPKKFVGSILRRRRGEFRSANRSTRLKTAGLLAGAALILASCFLLLDFFFLHSFLFKPEPSAPSVELVGYESSDFGFRLRYPEGFVAGEIPPDQQESDPLMLKLVRVNPPTLVLLWQESLGMAASFISQPLFDYLRDNIDRKYGADYNGFQKEGLEELEISGHRAFTVVFTFQNSEKAYREKIKETVIVGGKDAYHLQCMAPVEMWAEAEPACDAIRDSFEFTE